jgi:hypothetical protein
MKLFIEPPVLGKLPIELTIGLYESLSRSERSSAKSHHVPVSSEDLSSFSPPTPTPARATKCVGDLRGYPWSSFHSPIRLDAHGATVRRDR